MSCELLTISRVGVSGRVESVRSGELQLITPMSRGMSVSLRGERRGDARGRKKENIHRIKRDIFITKHADKALLYLSWMIVCFVFWGPFDVLSRFLFWPRVLLGLGGGDVPLDVCVSQFPTMTTGERGLLTLVVLTSTTERWLEESTGSSVSARSPLDNGL